MDYADKKYPEARAALEPAAMAILSIDTGLGDNLAVISLAISMKRAADALEKLAGEGYQNWSLVDIAGLIAQKTGG